MGRGMVAGSWQGRVTTVCLQFTFDGAYFWETSQRELYDETAFPIVESVIEGCASGHDALHPYVS